VNHPGHRTRSAALVSLPTSCPPAICLAGRQSKLEGAVYFNSGGLPRTVFLLKNTCFFSPIHRLPAPIRRLFRGINTFYSPLHSQLHNFKYALIVTRFYSFLFYQNISAMEPSHTIVTPENLLSLLKECLPSVVRQAVFESQQKRFLLLLNHHSYHEAIPVADISWITIKDDVLEFHVPALKKVLHHHGSLHQMEKMLNHPDFVRISKNTIVNSRHVVDLECKNCEIIMNSGMTLHYTSTYYPAVKEALFLI
jgi:hypothetical protein